MKVDIFNTKNELIGHADLDGQEHIDIMPFKGKITRVHNTLVGGEKKYYIIVEVPV